ncbi:MAG: endonuclease, partial [Pseudomonadota bacterium]
MTAQQLLTCVTWNVHRGYGGDGRKDPARIVDVLCQEVWSKGTDILVLQEADADEPPHPGVADPEQVEARTGLRYLHRDVSHRLTGQSHGFLGLVTYAAPHIMVEGMGLIDLPGICARGAVVVDLVVADVPLRLVATHLSLGQALRIAQTRTISQYLARRDP